MNSNLTESKILLDQISQILETAKESSSSFSSANPIVSLIVGIIINFLLIAKIVYACKHYASVFQRRVRQEMEGFGLKGESVRRGIGRMVSRTFDDISPESGRGRNTSIDRTIQKGSKRKSSEEAEIARGDTGGS